MGIKERIEKIYARSSRENMLHHALRLLGLDECNGNTAEDGGPGSGNYGHKGRPGKVGGSGPGGGKQYRGGRADIGYYGSRNDWLNGLQGERQTKAVRAIAKHKKGLQDLLRAKKKLIEWGNSGMITMQEAEQRIKEANLDKINENMTPEEFALRRGNPTEQKQLLDLMKESRSWGEKKDKLIDENLDEDEKKTLEFLSNEDFSKYTDAQKAKEASQVKNLLEAKAMGAFESEIDVPDEIQYEVGTKEKPVPKAVEAKREHFPKFLKPKQTDAFINKVNTIEGRDPDVSEMFTKIAEMEPGGVPAGVDSKVTYSDSNHRFTCKVYMVSGKIAGVSLRIPKMQNGEFATSEAGTTAHELGHYIDFLCREDKSKYGDLTAKYDSEFRDIMSKNGSTSEEMKQAFRDATDRSVNAGKAVRKPFNDKIDEINEKIKEALREKRYSDYHDLAKLRDALENESNKLAEMAEREAAGGYSSLMDIYQALGDVRRKFGHSYNTGGGRLSECWANWCELSLVFPKERKILEKEKPEFCALMKKMTNDILGRFNNGTK